MITGGIQSNKKPKVSIITAVYNAAELFETYIDNVVRFRNDNVELVMIDGGSTDGTLELLQQHNDKIDYWLSQPDNGIYDAMNKGITYAQGKWLYFLGVDDTLMDGFANMVNELQDAHTIYYGNTIYYGKLHKKIYDAYFLTKLNFVHQSLFYPKAVFDKYQYDLKYKVYADYYLNLQLWHNPAFKIEYRDLLIASFPEGGFSTKIKDLQFEKDKEHLFKKYLGRYAYYRYLNRTLGWAKTILHFVTHG